MPQILKDLESQELSRLNKTKDLFIKFGKLLEPIGPDTSDAQKKMKERSDVIDIPSDLKQFVSLHKPSNPPPPRVQYASYDSNSDISSCLYTPASGSGDKKSSGGIGGPSKIGSGSSASGIKPLGFLKKAKKDKPPKTDKPSEKGKQRDGVNNVTISSPSSSSSTTTATTTTTSPKNESALNTTTSSSNGPNNNSTQNSKSTSPTSTSATSPTSSVYTPSTNNNTNNSNKNNPPSTSSKPKKKDDEVKLRALYDYDATEENEISFKEGDTLYLVEKDDSGWWKGKTEKGKEGVFPSNFVELVGQEGNRTSVLSPKQGETWKCRALYDYDAEDENELTIKEGDILTIQAEEDGWYYGTNSQGKSGNFPSNYVEIDN